MNVPDITWHPAGELSDGQSHWKLPWQLLGAGQCPDVCACLHGQAIFNSQHKTIKSVRIVQQSNKFAHWEWLLL